MNFHSAYVVCCQPAILLPYAIEENLYLKRRRHDNKSEW